MIYHLFVEPGPLGDLLPGTNVFRYITFRTAWGLITALVVAYLVFPPFINWMKQQKMNQIIRNDGPESHLLNKIGTPTMGGVCILLGIAVSTLLWARLDEPVTWMGLTVMLGYGAIGFYDDWKKVMYQSSDGLAGRWKLVLQTLIGGGVVAWAYGTGVVDASLPVPFLREGSIDFAHLWDGAPTWLGWLYPAFAVFILVGASNAVNLTDGLDGLAIGPVMTCAATYGAIGYLAGNARFAGYLGIPYVAGVGELTVFSFAIVGAGLGFLWYNAYPAQVFMGDVGSLSLGGTLAVISILTKHEILLAIVGGIFVLEALSVIIQVVSFKTTGKRVFAMAPIHHHYEKKGWSEPKIIVRFWILSIILALVGLSTLKLR
ncbi:MAG: phospho-N-acetylmuramoyl-pentapeptide-transferase [Alphaproteobacteria bacterium]|nr:phospho-N-acetylmuramoyl-pentapeptide-transferase [Alphaproteobacteria bacterium]